MASHVRVILRADVATLGQQGDLVRVRPGYARNYLIPRGLALVETRASRDQVEHELQIAHARSEKARAALRKQAETIEGLRIQIAKEAGDQGKLFGSVTAQDIADAFEAQGFQIDRKKIVMPDEAVKMTGPYKLRLKIGQDVYAGFHLDVTTKA